MFNKTPEEIGKFLQERFSPLYSPSDWIRFARDLKGLFDYQLRERMAEFRSGELKATTDALMAAERNVGGLRAEVGDLLYEKLQRGKADEARLSAEADCQRLKEENASLMSHLAEVTADLAEVTAEARVLRRYRDEAIVVQRETEDDLTKALETEEKVAGMTTFFVFEEDGVACSLSEHRLPWGEGEEFAYMIHANTWEEACAIFNLRRGVEPYMPMGEAAPCPVCGSTYYPEGSGGCWKCGMIFEGEAKEDERGLLRKRAEKAESDLDTARLQVIEYQMQLEEAKNAFSNLAEGDADEVQVFLLDEEDLKKGRVATLAKLGMTFEELQNEAQRGEFSSGRARMVWAAFRAFGVVERDDNEGHLTEAPEGRCEHIGRGCQGCGLRGGCKDRAVSLEALEALLNICERKGLEEGRRFLALERRSRAEKAQQTTRQDHE